MGCECLYCHCSTETKPTAAQAKSYSKDWCKGFCRSCGTGCAEYSEEILQLKKENEQYRQALGRIAAGDVVLNSFEGYADEAYRRAAKLALEKYT